MYGDFAHSRAQALAPLSLTTEIRKAVLRSLTAASFVADLANIILHL